ncbi:MAG: hypothetical protein QW594_02925 [Candidatus Woesearchaeota archaeon]
MEVSEHQLRRLSFFLLVGSLLFFLLLLLFMPPQLLSSAVSSSFIQGKGKIVSIEPLPGGLYQYKLEKKMYVLCTGFYFPGVQEGIMLTYESLGNECFIYGYKLGKSPVD